MTRKGGDGMMTSQFDGMKEGIMIYLICADISRLERADYEELYRRASPERQKKADSYRRCEDSLRCVVADGLLRHVLGTGQYTVETEPGGKPRIAGRPDFHFNLSHAGDWVVLAWGSTPVGVDVERIREDMDYRAVARRFFSPEEQRAVEEAESPLRRFHEIWTGKESWLKYTGTGLKYDLRAFSALSLGDKLHLFTPELAEGYCLSLCTEEAQYSLEKIPAKNLL